MNDMDRFFLILGVGGLAVVGLSAWGGHAVGKRICRKSKI